MPNANCMFVPCSIADEVSVKIHACSISRKEVESQPLRGNGRRHSSGRKPFDKQYLEMVRDEMRDYNAKVI